MVVTHRHIGSVTICEIVYDCRSFSPYSGQCCLHIEGAPLLQTPVLNKTPRLSSVRMFVRLYRLLLIHCIYVSVTKPACPAFSAWLNTGSLRSLKVTEKAIMLLICHCHQSYVQHYMANLMLVQCVIASHQEVWTCQFWLEIYQELTVFMVQVQERTAV